MKKRNQHIGSSLDDFLKEEGVLEETRAVVLKETLAWQVQQAMKETGEGNCRRIEQRHAGRQSSRRC